MIEFGPLYQEGALLLENADTVRTVDLDSCQFGVQVAADGRVWVCVNGVAFLRFKPKAIETVMVDERHAKMLDDLPYVQFSDPAQRSIFDYEDSEE